MRKKETLTPDLKIGQRNTRQRTAVLEALESLDHFSSAQDIHALLEQGGKKVGLTTVYRTLQHLTSLGVIDTLQDTGGENLYRRCSTDIHHHHLVCTHCRKTIDIDGGPVEEWAEKIAQQEKFKVTGHTAEIFGICSDCADQ